MALALEILHYFRNRPIFRYVSLAFGIAGLLAQTLFLLVQPLLLASPFGSMIFLAWILAVFYLYGAFHHNRVSWGIFVLPVVLLLVGLASISKLYTANENTGSLFSLFSRNGGHYWGMLHGIMVLLASVGIAVGFLASIMYLIQAYRLQTKVPPRKGMQLLSLERLENMNRRAITVSFPLLTLGLLVSVGLGLDPNYREAFVSWTNPKLLGIAALWLVMGIILYLRYIAHASARQVAIWTIVAFALMVFSVTSNIHPLVSGGGP